MSDARDDHRRPQAQPLPAEVPPVGNLWSLALGWRGVVAWRRARTEAGLTPADFLIIGDEDARDEDER